MPKDKPIMLYVWAAGGQKSKAGNLWGILETVVLEGESAQVVTIFCGFELSNEIKALGLAPLAPIECEFEQRMTGNGPRFELVAIMPVGG